MYFEIPSKSIDKPIYRIISYRRLLEMFENKANVLVKPCLWEDTFENFILKSNVKHKNGDIVQYNYHDRIYGQCWSLHSASDAMWRIYSPDKTGIRIRTSIRKLYESLYAEHSEFSGANNCIGKVSYLRDNWLMAIADDTFDESGITLDKLFRTLLIKRRAFVHEKEVRILFHAWGDYSCESKIHSYRIDPHELIDQIMIDPRVNYQEFKQIKSKIKEELGYNGSIKRSLLYRLPKDKVLEVTNDFNLDE